jgi:hypothetical protein
MPPTSSSSKKKQLKGQSTLSFASRPTTPAAPTKQKNKKRAQRQAKAKAPTATPSPGPELTPDPSSHQGAQTPDGKRRAKQGTPIRISTTSTPGPLPKDSPSPATDGLTPPPRLANIATQSPQSPLPLSLQVDTKKPISQKWLRCLAKVSPSTLQPFEVTAFHHPTTDKDLKGIDQMLKLGPLSLSWREGTVSQEAFQDLIISALDKTTTSSNPFYKADFADHGVADKKKFSKMLIPMARTPSSHLPSFVAQTSTLQDPSPWEILWLETLNIFGAVADLGLASQALPPATLPGPLPPPLAKAHRTTQVHRRFRIHDNTRKFTTYIRVEAPQLDPYLLGVTQHKAY